jgi:hypothetical protein
MSRTTTEIAFGIWEIITAGIVQLTTINCCVIGGNRDSNLCHQKFCQQQREPLRHVHIGWQGKSGYGAVGFGIEWKYAYSAILRRHSHDSLPTFGICDRYFEVASAGRFGVQFQFVSVHCNDILGDNGWYLTIA